MNTANQAIAAYHAATTPTAIRKVVRAAKRCGHDFITAAVVRQSAADQLIEELEAAR